MQRRAAATYAAIFILVAAGAYAVIGVATEPAVTIEDPAYSLSAGDAFTPADRTYTVAAVSSGTNVGNDLRAVDLTWVNETARYTASIDHNSTVPAAAVVWSGQAARSTATLENDTTVTVGGTEYRLVVAAGESPTSFTLVGGEEEQTVAAGDTIAYEGEQATVTRITSDAVTLAWGEPYRLLVENATDPSAFTLTQAFNVSARLAEDPAVEDQTVTRADGNRYVVYEANGSTTLLSEYLPEPEVRTMREGETLEFQGNETTVAAVDNESVTLAWSGPRTNTLSLSEGDRTTFADTEYVAHFPDNSTFALTADVDAYEAEIAAVDTYHERINGFWGVSIISGLAAILLLGTAYLPSRY